MGSVTVLAAATGANASVAVDRFGAAATPDYGALLGSSLLALAVIAVLAVVIVALSKRWTGGANRVGGDVIAVVARTQIEPKRSLLVIEVGGKSLLLGSSEAGLSLLTELEPGSVPASLAKPASNAFATMVRDAIARRRGKLDPEQPS